MKIKMTGKRALIAAGLLAGVLYLYAIGSEQREQEGKDAGTTANTDTQCRVEATVDGLNVRSAPAMNPSNVVDQLGRGDESDAAKEVRNGFRKLADDRWVSTKYVQPLDGRDCG